MGALHARARIDSQARFAAVNRRGFFTLMGGAAVAALTAEQLAELLLPKRTIFLPPRPSIEALAVTFKLSAADFYVREYGKMINEMVAFTAYRVRQAQIDLMAFGRSEFTFQIPPV